MDVKMSKKVTENVTSHDNGEHKHGCITKVSKG